MGASGMGGVGGIVGGTAPGGPMMPMAFGAWPSATAQDVIGENETPYEDTTPDTYDRKPDYTRSAEQPVTPQEGPNAGYNVDRVNTPATDTTTPVTNEAETLPVRSVPEAATDTTTPETVGPQRTEERPAYDPNTPHGAQSSPRF